MQRQKRKKACTQPLEERDAMEDIMDFCNGEIVESVPNMQLMHMMLVYGPCGGGNGLCMGTVQWNQRLQSSIYSRYMHCVVNTLSPSQACNMQGMLVPNDYTDSFCRLLLDMDSAQSLITSSLSSDTSLQTFMKELLQVCRRCFDLRIIDCNSTITPPPELGKPDKNIQAWLKDVLLKWICSVYEAHALCCFEEKLRLPSPSRMGMSSGEFRNWQDVAGKIAQKRLNILKNHCIPDLVRDENLEKTLKMAWEQAVTLEVVCIPP